ncbi:MAG: stage III sporulation protein AB [Clostridia bacterium]
MFKTLGITLIIGSTSAFGVAKKIHYLHRVKSLEQIVLMINIMQRELTFNCPKTAELIKLLSNELTFPICEIFKKMHKNLLIDDDLSVKLKWSKMFQENTEKANLTTHDVEIISNIANVIGKFDVEEQVKSLEYYKSLILENLQQAKLLYKNEGNIIRAISISLGMIIAIILI